MEGVEAQQILTMRAGERFSSAVCSTEIIVVRPPAEGVDLRCGGVAMRPVIDSGDRLPIDTAFSGGTQIGKRYSDSESGLEVLCTKNGEGLLSIGERMLCLKQSKPLPSSD